MAIAPAAGEALPGITIAIGLLAAVMYVVFVGLHGMWAYTFGYVFDKVGGVSIVGVHPLGFLKDASNSVANTLLAGAAKSDHLMGYLFHWAGVMQGWLARELLALSVDVYGWATWLQRSHLPRWVKALIYALVPPLVLPAVLKALRGVKYGHVVTRIKTLEHTVTERVTRVVKTVAVAGATVPGWVIRLPGRIGHVERELPSIRKRLRKLEKYAGATGAVALVLAALGKLGLNWVRCRNVKNVGKRVCGMDSDLLDSLLSDGLLLVGTLSVVEFATALRDIEDVALDVLRAGIVEWPG